MSTPAQDTPAIQLVGLTKRFGRTLAVNNLTLNIPRGSTFGLIGPNGAGKSTTIKMLMGMLSITSGEARVLGTWVDDRSGGGQTAGRLRARDASHLPLDARRRGDRFLQVVFPLVERPDLPGDGRVVRPRLGEESKTSLEGNAGEAGAAVGRFARSGTVVVGRAALRLGPDRPGRVSWTACCARSAIGGRRC